MMRSLISFECNPAISWRLLRVGFVIVSGALLLAACQPALTALPAGELRTFAVAPTGDYLAMGGSQGVYVYRLSDGELLWTKRTSQAVESLTFKPDGTQLLGRLADEANTILLWQVQDAQRLRKWKLNFPTQQTMPLAWSPDGTEILLKGDGLSAILMLDVHRNQLYRLDWEGVVIFLTGHHDFSFDSAWSPDGKLLAFCAYNQAIEMWDVPNNERVKQLYWKEPGFYQLLQGVAFNSTGTRLAATSTRRVGLIWDLATQAVVLNLEAPAVEYIDRADDSPYFSHRVGENQLVWSPDDRWLITGTRTGAIIVWDATTGAIAQILQGHTTPVLGLSFRPDNGHLLSASQNEVFEWDLATGTRWDAFAQLLITP